MKKDGMRKLRTWCATLVILNLTANVSAETLDDFDSDESLGSRWTASGEIQAARNPIPAEGPEDAGANGPAGNALRIDAKGDFAIYTKVPTPDAISWRNAESLAFWIYQSEDRESRIDILALEPDRKAFFWRKCEFSGAGWQRIEMPLRWFRWADRRLPRWSEVKLFGLRGSGGFEFWVDGFELIDNDPNRGSDYTVEDLAALAFPDADPEALRITADDQAWVLSDAPGFDSARLHKHLVKVREAIETDIPRWKREENYLTPRLIVFQDEPSYRAFFERVGQQLLATIVPPTSGGYHVQGIAVSFYDEEWGELRPVFTHEFVHSLVTLLGLQGSSGGDWFHEGIANLYQLRAQPQAGLSEIIKQGLEDASYRNSLSGLCSGVGIPNNRYWQALSVMDFLIRGEGIGEKFDQLLERIEATGSVDLREHFEPVYGIDFDEFEAGWQAFAKENLTAYDGE